MNLKPWTKTQYGVPPVCGNVLLISMTTMPCVHSLEAIIEPPIQERGFILRDIAFAMVYYNIGTVAEKTYTNGVIAFAGKAYMLVDGFRKDKLHIVGLQECRSKEGGTSKIGDYQKVIPDVKGQAAGDVELWFNTVVPWDAEDFKSVLSAGDAQIVATGPKFMTVHFGNTWINMDIVVAAPHSWDTKHQEGAEDLTYAFWEYLKEALKKRAQPHASLFFLGDANIELSHGQMCYDGIGSHQFAKEATRCHQG